MKQHYKKLPALLLTLIVGLMATSTAFGTATIVIENGDAAGVGFNDPNPAAPVGGNSGTTVGQQRLNAFQFAANIWGATLTSGPTITIRASWASLSCTPSSGTLGSAGNSGSIWRDFSGAVPGTWYGNALRNALTSTDGNGATAEIVATFNVNLGTTGCLESLHWYYGLDTSTDPNGINLVTVLLHEFAHGLGFQTFTNRSTGLQAGSDAAGRFPSIYDRFLFDSSTGKTWPQMTDAERVASAINTNNLVWNGPQVVSDVPGVLVGTPRLRVNSPPAIAGNYQVGTADFGAQLTTAGVTAALVQALDPSDGSGTLTTDACSPLTNAGDISGKIALIDRGTCTFVVKTKNAQNAGAIGVVIANDVAGSPPPGLGGSDPTITIPAVMITQGDGNTIKAQLASGVNATLLVDGSAPTGADSSGRPRMFAPNPVQGGSSVSHWDTSLSPNQLMEPSINSDLSHSVVPPQDLTFSLLRDLSWCSGCAPPPTPSPTPTPSPPANNDFANAQIISGCSGSVNGTNVGANKETGEPSHSPDNDPGGGSVWYKWQAPSSSSVTITTAGSNYDTLLAVYTGNSVGALTAIAKNDDVDTLGGILTSTVTFSATSGIIYKIAVDGFGGDRGNIVLNWTQGDCPTTQVTSSFNPSYVTAPVTFTATVTASPPGSGTPTGTVDFFDGTAIPGNAIAGCDARPLNGSGVATCTTTALTSAGSPHTITARYNGDGNFEASSGTFVQTVNAQSQRTFVSAQHGADANQAATPACSVTQPCRNFNAAISAVRAGGEVVALDSGGYGSVTISKAVTLTGPPGVYAAITALTVGSSAITVSAPPTDTVVLRGLTLTGLGGQNGINVTSVGNLHVEGCVISGFTQMGIWVHLAADGSHIFVKDTITRNNGHTGIQISSSTGTVRASIDDCRSERNFFYGFYAYHNSRVTIHRSVASGNGSGGSGFIAASMASGATTELSCEECVSSNNHDGFAVIANLGAATMRVSHSTATNNTGVGFSQGTSGVFESLGNNLVRGNTGGDTSGTITVITAQ